MERTQFILQNYARVFKNSSVFKRSAVPYCMVTTGILNSSFDV